MSTPLYIRSEYSLLQSLCPINRLVKEAFEDGYKALALTDFEVLAGVGHFNRACRKAGIKPLFGMELRVLLEGNIYPLVVLAKDDNAYLKLMHLATLINESDKIIDIVRFNEYVEGSFVILSSDNMYATSAFLRHEDALKALKKTISFFRGDVYVGLYDNDKAFNRHLNKEIKEACRQLNIPTVYMMKTLYLHQEDLEAYGVIKAIAGKQFLDDPDLIVEENRYLYKPSELKELYDEDDLLNSDKIAVACNVELHFKTSLPAYHNNKGVSSKDYLINLCKEGLKRRLKGHKNTLYEKRLRHELNIIIKMHFADYFLIVYDFILYAKKHDILVGPGRGSAAGSLVAYCLGITDIDPLRYGLIFERFLNPERVTMPDIDVDLPDDRRDEVIAYCLEKYGKEHIGHIVTYGTLKAKQALRDVGRVLRYPLNEIDSLCKILPNDPKMTLAKAYEIPAFRARINSDKKWLRLYELSLKIEGLPRHASTHAAGIVMSLKNLDDVVPLFSLEDNMYTTQITMEYLEAFGLIKMDFLGLRNLSILHEIVAEVKKEKPDFNIANIPLDDQKTFALIKNVNTLGIFQLESSGMQNLIRRLQPENFEEIALTIALFRPGPMENIPQFVENRRHPEKIKYLHQDIKDILKDTYGIIVYQEQIMMIATKMAGFSMAKADILRKAMSKKKADELKALADEFINGCIARGYGAELAKEVYALILKFADYGFNKSHSVAYAKTAYELAYLKANYPLFFYKALLNGVIGAADKTYEYILECFKIKLSLKGVSLNHSYDYYIIEDASIVLPLSIIKDVGMQAVANIVKDRNLNGPFKDYEDAVCRLYRLNINRNAIESMILAGAFDEFGLSRKTMKENLMTVLKYAATYGGEQLSLGNFDMRPVLNIYRDYPLSKAKDEKKVLGFYFSLNPLWELKKRYNLSTEAFCDLLKKSGNINGFGEVYRVKEHRTKNGEWMAFLEVHDDTGELDLAIMPNVYRQYQGQIKKNDYLYFSGLRQKEKSCLVRRLNIYKGDENA